MTTAARVALIALAAGWALLAAATALFVLVCRWADDGSSEQ